ncbi:unnamed protein product [Ceutorhynchus assimilis]|uniref:Uncharacterized protein n=1 Tax=Ceutorhynchus assimilis TaxID=467358 RepID=A0A9N9MIJ9_9CUCU|nr:unnamed protein product [Ceutorhynchus assimilis]
MKRNKIRENWFKSVSGSRKNSVPTSLVRKRLSYTRVKFVTFYTRNVINYCNFRRLQNDISSLSYDSRDARNELEICKRQVEDLKRQLQHYVAEIKRTEDLITNKELERNELLDQFKSLSQEANVLESNNHTLESEANQCKVQLSVALDHSTEMERRVEHQENTIRSYEKQIADLSAQVARLEVQLKQTTREQEQCNTEMKQMRDLCQKLDKDKDTLKNELYNKEDRQSQSQRVTNKLNAEMATLREALEEEKSRLEGVEKLLIEARRETTSQRLLNQDLQHEIKELQQTVRDLKEKLLNCETKYKDRKSKVVRTELSDGQGSDQIIPDGYSSPTKSDVPKKRTSLLSTKTLTQHARSHGVFDLTSLETLSERNAQDAKVNRKNLERCDESTHKKLLAKVAIGQPIYCPVCRELIKPRKKAEIEKSPQTGLHNVAKNVDQKQGTIKTTSESSKNEAPGPISLASVKSLTWEDKQLIRMKSKGQTDLTCFEKNDNARGANGKNDNADTKEAQPPGFREVKNVGSDPSIWSEFNMVNDYVPRMKTCRCPKCVSEISLSEPDIRSPIDTAACLKEKSKPSDPNDAKRGAFCKKSQNKPGKGNKEAKSQLSSSSENTEVQTKFDQSSDSSAVFHKVFCVDGVGIKCHCCISSFRRKDD